MVENINGTYKSVLGKSLRRKKDLRDIKITLTQKKADRQRARTLSGEIAKPFHFIIMSVTNVLQITNTR